MGPLSPWHDVSSDYIWPPKTEGNYEYDK